MIPSAAQKRLPVSTKNLPAYLHRSKPAGQNPCGCPRCGSAHWEWYGKSSLPWAQGQNRASDSKIGFAPLSGSEIPAAPTVFPLRCPAAGAAPSRVLRADGLSAGVLAKHLPKPLAHRAPSEVKFSKNAAFELYCLKVDRFRATFYLKRITI